MYSTRQLPAVPFLPARAVRALAVTAVAGALVTGCAGTSGHTHPATADTVMMTHAETTTGSASVRLYTTMRQLWAQHMEWTWSAIAAFAADSPGLSATLDRLLQNQADIGDAVRPFYGQAAADRLTELLKTHIREAVPVLQAAKAGDQAALDTAVADWFANAKEIADFLASANPHWQRGDMEQMMHQHISQTIAYAAEQLQGQYAASIADFDTAEAHMADMADMLSAGLVAQFPQRFRN